MDFATKMITNEEGEVIKVMIWDTVGQERYRAIGHSYYRGAHCALLVYDITNRESFESIRSWLAELQSMADENIVLMLVGNMKENEEMRKVSTEEAASFAEQNEMAFIETSTIDS